MTCPLEHAGAGAGTDEQVEGAPLARDCGAGAEISSSLLRSEASELHRVQGRAQRSGALHGFVTVEVGESRPAGPDSREDLPRGRQNKVARTKGESAPGVVKGMAQLAREHGQ